MKCIDSLSMFYMYDDTVSSCCVHCT